MRAIAPRLVAEALGTALLVTAVVGSGIMAERLTDIPALALLCNTIATGAVLVVLVSIFAPTSGAHFNPAVTFAFALRRELRPRTALCYVAVQILGGLVGVVLAHLMFEASPLAIGDHARTGGAQWLSEAVATFALVLTIRLALRQSPGALPWLVGLVIVSAYWFTASTSFANPAVTIARGFTNSFAGIALVDVPAFVLAQLLGAIGALTVAGFFLRPDSPRVQNASGRF